MQTILRIEHPETGYGIFTSSSTEIGKLMKTGADWLLDRAYFYDRHDKFPTPSHDHGLKPYIRCLDDFCAFKSIEEFQQWILPEETKQFIKMGFKILLLDVSECMIGEYQVLFRKKNIIQSKDITHLFE